MKKNPKHKKIPEVKVKKHTVDHKGTIQLTLRKPINIPGNLRNRLIV